MILLSPIVLLENFFSWTAVIQIKIAAEAEKKGGAEWGYRVLFGFVQVREEGREGRVGEKVAGILSLYG